MNLLLNLLATVYNTFKKFKFKYNQSLAHVFAVQFVCAQCSLPDTVHILVVGEGDTGNLSGSRNPLGKCGHELL